MYKKDKIWLAVYEAIKSMLLMNYLKEFAECKLFCLRSGS